MANVHIGLSTAFICNEDTLDILDDLAPVCPPDADREEMVDILTKLGFEIGQIKEGYYFIDFDGTLDDAIRVCDAIKSCVESGKFIIFEDDCVGVYTYEF